MGVAPIQSDVESQCERHSSLTAGAASGLFCLWLALLMFAAGGEGPRSDTARAQAARTASSLGQMLGGGKRDPAAARAVLVAELKQANKARPVDHPEAILGSRSAPLAGAAPAANQAGRADHALHDGGAGAFHPRAPPRAFG